LPATTRRTQVDDPYAELKAHFAGGGADDVTVNSGKGAQGIKLGKKMFAMFYKGELLRKFVPERVAELVASGEGQAFDPGAGAPLADRVLISAARKDAWIALCEESLRYAAARP